MSVVKHSGEVVRLGANTVYVKMMVNSACSGCHAKAVCGVDESEEKIVEVENVNVGDYNIGDKVEVALQSGSMGTKAVVLTYVVPFFVLTIMLIAALALGLSEGAAVLIALGGIAAYYMLLYAMRGKIKNTIKFIIIKQTK